MRGLIAALGAVVFIALVPAAQADVQPYATNDAGGFHDVLPPGANGLANGVQLAAFLTTGQRPPHSDDQLAMYRDLMYATPGPQGRGPRALLQGLDLRREARGRRRPPSRPRADVTIVRDKSLRRSPTSTGRRAPGRCSAPATPPRRTACSSSTSCATSAARSCPRSSAARPPTAPWTPSSGRSRPTRRPTSSASSTSATTSTATAAASCRTTRSATSPASTSTSPRRAWTRPRCRASTSPIGRPQGPDDWKVTDLFSTASLVGGIFGKGGGRELAESQLLDAFKAPLRRQEGPHALGAVRGLRRPRRADHRQGQALPVPDQAEEAREGRRGAARPGLVQGARGLALVDGAARDRRPAAGRQPALPSAAAPRGAVRAGRAVAARASLRPVAARRPGPARARPAAQGDVQRAARLGRQLGQRPPARGLRPAGRLLRPRRS